MRQLTLSEAALLEINDAIKNSTAYSPNAWDHGPAPGPTPEPPPVTRNPYSGPGLIAVLRAVWPDRAPQLEQALITVAGSVMMANMYTDGATHANEQWNTAVSIMVSGFTPEIAWAGVQKGVSGILVDPAFALADLQAAKVVIDGYRTA